MLQRRVVVTVAVVLLSLCRPAFAQQGEPPSAGKLPGLTGWTDEGQDNNWQVFLKPAGKIRAVMLFVDFPNHAASEAPMPFGNTETYYEFLGPGAVQWYKDSSYNALNLEITPIHKWYHMSHVDDDYLFERGLTWEAHVNYAGEALALADADVDFSKFDLFYIVPVRTASKITFSPAYIDDSPYWGWPAWVVLDNANITHGVTTGQDAWTYWGSKVLNHETNHTFGLPDLYAFDGKWTWAGKQWLWDYHYFVGGWELMGLITGPAPDLLAWHKWKLGWVTDDQVDVVTKAGTTEHHLTPIERNGSN
jgi:M6 family metalloprotease-like protein